MKVTEELKKGHELKNVQHDFDDIYISFYA